MIIILLVKVFKTLGLKMLPPLPKLRRLWTSDKMVSLALIRNRDLGINIFKNIYSHNPKSITEILYDVDQRALSRGFTHRYGVRPHRSTVAVHNGKLMERRVYFNPWKIEWIPITCGYLPPE